MDDEDTLDEPEELLEQARNAAAKNQVPDEEPAGADDEAIPAHTGSPLTGLDDETIPAGRSVPSLLVGDDDDTIDVDPGLIRRLREQRAQQQPTDPDQTSTKEPTDPNNTARKPNRRRVIGAAATALIAATVTVVIILAIAISSPDNSPASPATVDPEPTVGPTTTSAPETTVDPATTTTSAPETTVDPATTTTTAPEPEPAISAGSSHSCGVTVDGVAQCWGDNGDGRLDVPAGQFTAISTGSSHSCGVTVDGVAQCWGNSSSGRLDAPAGHFTAISAGSSHSCGVTVDGVAQCWGSNSSGQSDAPAGQFTAFQLAREVSIDRQIVVDTSLTNPVPQTCLTNPQLTRDLSYRLRLVQHQRNRVSLELSTEPPPTPNQRLVLVPSSSWLTSLTRCQANGRNLTIFDSLRHA